jgi:transcription elongation factor SPT6
VTNAILTANIFVNAASYLRIPCEDLAKVEQGTDVLDMTRVHPEDYDVARKMAADALDRDEMDANPDDPSSAVTAVMLPENVAKLADLQLDDFAAELNKILGVPKRLALYAVRREMVSPYSEVRYNFAKPTVVNVFTMLTGESKATLEHGLIVPVRVIRTRQDEVVLVRLDSGIEGSIAENYRTNGQVVTRPKPGQILQAYVMELKPDDFTVELSTQENLIERGDADRRRVMPDNCYDHGAAQADKDSQVAKEQKRTGRSKRQITHPNFHNFNAGEAEQFLAHQQRGDCVIRPSSKEDHLAVTWKVDEGVYQHIGQSHLLPASSMCNTDAEYERSGDGD